MEKTNLEKVFQREFRESGENWKACCPFHDEKTPSFLVHKEKYLANCFGCGIGGPIDVLASKYLAVAIEEALERLRIDPVAKLSVRLDEKKRTKTTTTFPESWLAPYKKEVHKYVINRGFREDILKGSKTRYDSTFKRQVFPHYSRDGKLLGAIGRACREQEPKWYFYWGYDKGEALYAPFLEERYQSLRPTLVVEGVFDYLWVIQNDLEVNCVATLGALPTRSQLVAIKDVGERVIAGFDNDDAGRQGAAHLYTEVRKSHQVSLVRWPNTAKDWMDLDKLRGQELIDNSVSPLKASFIDPTLLVCACKKHEFHRRTIRAAKNVRS